MALKFVTLRTKCTLDVRAPKFCHFLVKVQKILKVRGASLCFCLQYVSRRGAVARTVKIVEGEEPAACKISVTSTLIERKRLRFSAADENAMAR